LSDNFDKNIFFPIFQPSIFNIPFFPLFLHVESETIQSSYFSHQ